MANESYQREDLAEGAPANAEGLLQWAEEIATGAPSENVFRNKEGRVTLRFSQKGGSFFLKLHRGIGWGCLERGEGGGESETHQHHPASGHGRPSFQYPARGARSRGDRKIVRKERRRRREKRKKIRN